MPKSTPTQERALEAARAVWRRGGTKAEGVEVGRRFINDSTPAGYFPQYPGQPRMTTFPAAHVPITTVEEADRLGNYLAEYDNYPVGMSPCFVAGINGDAAEGCPFAGEDFCKCDKD